MNRTFSDVNKDGNLSTEIQLGMHLNSTLLMMEFGPGIQTKTQINGGAVERIDHIVQVNPEIIVIDVQRLCLFNEDLNEVSINAPVPFLIGISKGRSGNRFADVGVIQLARKSSQTVLNITKTFPACELGKNHN